MGKMGYAVNSIAVISIVFFNIIFCFPYSLPVAVPTMNYNSVILAGVTFLATVWWFVHARSKYLGPKLGGFIVTEEGRRLADK